MQVNDAAGKRHIVGGMNTTIAHRFTMAAMFALALAGTPASAQEARTADGLSINLGIMPAAVAVTAAGHREAHPRNFPPGSQHLLVTLDEEKTHKRVGDAEVVVEVTDPHGRVERKPLLHTQAGGLPDYSELFEFGWSGKYTIRVIITPHGATKPIQAVFTVDNVV